MLSEITAEAYRVTERERHRLQEAMKVEVVTLPEGLSDAQVITAFRSALTHYHMQRAKDIEEVVVHPRTYRDLLNAFSNTFPFTTYDASTGKVVLFGVKVRPAINREMEADKIKREGQIKNTTLTDTGQSTITLMGRAHGKTASPFPISGVSNITFDVHVSTDTNPPNQTLSLQELIDKALKTREITPLTIYGPGQEPPESPPEPPKKKARETTSRSLGTQKKKR